MIRGHAFVGPHAVRRYRERHRPDLTYEEAREELVDALEDAHVVKRSGDCVVMRTGRRFGRVRLVVGPGQGGPLPALLTVLPGHTGGLRC